MNLSGTFVLYGDEANVRWMIPHLRVAHGKRIADSAQWQAVIPWAPTIDPMKGACGRFVLNKAVQTAIINDPIQIEHRLRLHGLQWYVPTTAPAGSSIRGVRKYAVPVFHLQALALFEHESNLGLLAPVIENGRNAFREIELNLRLRQHRRIVSTAVRALYCLGLDFGMVTVCVLGDEGIQIERVSPVPRLNRRLGRLFALAINVFAEQLEIERASIGERSQGASQRNVLLGMDPEFVLNGPGDKIVMASKFLQKKGPVGCDSIRLNDRRIVFPLAELRPQPHEEPQQLVIYLHRTMRLAARLITDANLQWLAGGMPRKGLPLGGHIHFSGVWLNVNLLRALDNYLALPLTLLEDVTTRRRRPRYGCIGDFREQPHGGFEYRTLPSWIISPMITLGVLSLARLIADHYSLLEAQPLNDVSVQQAYYTGDKQKLLPVVQKLWPDIRATPSYAKYERYLLPFKQRMDRLVSWDERADFRKAWKIPPFES